MRIFIIFSFWLIFGSAEAQTEYFQGKIISETKFVIKDSTKRAIYFSSLNPNQTIEYFKEGNTFDIYDKGRSKTYLYLRAQNKAYFNEWNDDTLIAIDGGRQGRKIITYSLLPTNDTILGFQCSKLIISYEGGTTTYYFNKSALKINPAWYEKLTYVNWNFISKTLECIPLRTVIERSDYKLTNTLVSFTNENVPDKFFIIPPNVTIVEEK
jgi:hypothetical protein